MCIPTQIQLNTVKMVKIGPESAGVGRLFDLMSWRYLPACSADLQPQIGHNIGLQAPISMR